MYPYTRCTASGENRETERGREINRQHLYYITPFFGLFKPLQFTQHNPKRLNLAHLDFLQFFVIHKVIKYACLSAKCISFMKYVKYGIKYK